MGLRGWGDDGRVFFSEVHSSLMGISKSTCNSRAASSILRRSF
jgi:hypothetical protein